MRRSEKTILITRPEEDALQTVELLKEKNYNVICEPFLEVTIHKDSLGNLEKYSGLVFTSKNAVRSFCNNSNHRSLPVWVVGDATASVASKYGFKDIRSASGNVRSLQNILTREFFENPLLYVRGEYVSSEFKDINLEEKILYRTGIKEKISYDVLEDLTGGRVHVALFFSTRTAQAFVKAMDNEVLKNALKHTKALCLGESMVESLSVLPWKAINVAKKPNQKSLIELLD